LTEIDCTEEDVLYTCESKICGEDGKCQPCSANSDCPINYACDSSFNNADGEASVKNFCILILEIDCPSDDFCPTLYCNSLLKCQYCYDNAGTYTCGTNEVCISPGYCTSIEPDGDLEECTSDSDCASSTNYCDMSYEEGPFFCNRCPAKRSVYPFNRDTSSACDLGYYCDYN
jgi:hypothetical protein